MIVAVPRAGARLTVDVVFTGLLEQGLEGF